MDLYARWHKTSHSSAGNLHYWLCEEQASGRAAALGDLAVTIRSHYDLLSNIADDVARIGFDAASDVLRTSMPDDLRARSGDLGEILATEFVEESLNINVPVRRLRYKDGREMAMRGDDFIGVVATPTGTLATLVKGEAKSRAHLDRATVVEARTALDRDGGRCTPHSLLFVANRLIDSGDDAARTLGRSLRDEVGLKALDASSVSHVLFTVSGNGAHASLKNDLDEADSTRVQHAVNVRIPDHRDFIERIYEEALALGSP